MNVRGEDAVLGSGRSGRRREALPAGGDRPGKQVGRLGADLSYEEGPKKMNDWEESAEEDSIEWLKKGGREGLLEPAEGAAGGKSSSRDKTG